MSQAPTSLPPPNSESSTALPSSQTRARIPRSCPRVLRCGGVSLLLCRRHWVCSCGPAVPAGTPRHHAGSRSGGAWSHTRRQYLPAICTWTHSPAGSGGSGAKTNGRWQSKGTSGACSCVCEKGCDACKRGNGHTHTHTHTHTHKHTHTSTHTHTHRRHGRHEEHLTWTISADAYFAARCSGVMHSSPSI